MIFGETPATTGVLGGAIAMNATNGHNIRGLTYTPSGIATTILGTPIGIHGTSSPYSFHTGGAHFTMGDGSVRFVNENVNFATFIGLCTPAGSEVLSEF
jgi:prepilin-type processing-associated H-X9-DG protein